MKKRFCILVTGLLAAVLLLTGCGEGKGAEDTGPDGLVGDRNTTSHSTTTTTTTNNNGKSGNNLWDDAERFAEDIMPGGQATERNR